VSDPRVGAIRSGPAYPCATTATRSNRRNHRRRTIRLTPQSRRVVRASKASPAQDTRPAPPSVSSAGYREYATNAILRKRIAPGSTAGIAGHVRYALRPHGFAGGVRDLIVAAAPWIESNGGGVVAPADIRSGVSRIGTAPAPCASSGSVPRATFGGGVLRRIWPLQSRGGLPSQPARAIMPAVRTKEGISTSRRDVEVCGVGCECSCRHGSQVLRSVAKADRRGRRVLAGKGNQLSSRWGAFEPFDSRRISSWQGRTGISNMKVMAKRAGKNATSSADLCKKSSASAFAHVRRHDFHIPKCLPTLPYEIRASRRARKLPAT